MNAGKNLTVFVGSLDILIRHCSTVKRSLRLVFLSLDSACPVRMEYLINKFP